MSKICGYNCEHNKSGVCQISVCDKKQHMSDKTEVQTFTRYIDPTITELQQENKQLKANWNTLWQYILEKDNRGYEKVYTEDILDKMQELEQGSDNNEQKNKN